MKFVPPFLHVNGELADILGNFIFRTLSFTSRYFEGKVPPASKADDRDREVLDEIITYREKVSEAYETFHFKEAIAQSMNLARLGNKYFTETEPWHLRKNDPEKCGTVLHVCLQIAAALSLIFEPVMPSKMQLLREYLGTKSLGWNDITSSMLETGHTIDQGEILFKKMENEETDRQLEKLRQRSSEKAQSKGDYEPLKKNIDFETFQSMDLRMGEVISAVKVPKSKNLLKLQVDLGFETRTVVSGIAKQYEPEHLKGKKIVLVANLEPKKLMGIESRGMILMAEDYDGRFQFLTADAEPGSVIS